MYGLLIVDRCIRIGRGRVGEDGGGGGGGGGVKHERSRQEKGRGLGE